MNRPITAGQLRATYLEFFRQRGHAVIPSASVVQRGSNITHERLRFDFPHDSKLTAAEVAEVEALVNRWLARDLAVTRSTMTEPEARLAGALGAFGEKYGKTVSVYTVCDRATGEVISRELCGGPHVASSAELSGRFRIVREEAISAGIRRVKAVLDRPTVPAVPR
jgi:alanyl-tRNA synthetase